MSFAGLNSYREPSHDQQVELIKRPSIDVKELDLTVQGIFDQVGQDGDKALRDFTSRFDQVELESIALDLALIQNSAHAISNELKSAIDRAYENIRLFHQSQELQSNKVTTSVGVECWQESRAIQKVGLYIPGGSAPLFSTVLMLGIPAQIASCEERILCTPPDRNGNIHPAILYAASLCGINKVFTVGGAQAIAAMVMGTESIPSVYKIFGPGNQYVTAAKMKALDYNVAIDLPAGPSEVLVYADDSCYPKFVAADLLSQAEHGPDSQVVLVATNSGIVEQVNQELNFQLEQLPRKEIATVALKHAYSCVIEDVEQAFDFINLYAPEHFIISSDQADNYLALIQNAGSVFIGNWTPESAGDYASGTNHTLPTSAFARTYSGVSLDSFVKKVTFQKISKIGINDLGPTIRIMAEEEELQGHANAVKFRMDEV